MRQCLDDGNNETMRLAVARKLARAVNSLADHYEILGGPRP